MADFGTPPHRTPASTARDYGGQFDCKEEPMQKDRNEIFSMVGLWITLIVSNALLFQQLAANGLLA
jgi:hypothetical protein